MPRPLIRTAVFASAIAFLLNLALLVGPDGALLSDGGQLGGYYDVQARAFLHGHLAVPPGSLGIEGFVVRGHTYTYFGPLLAILRLPVLAVTHGLDGKLTQPSMLVALCVLLGATAALQARARALLRPGAAPSRFEAALVALVQLGVGCGVPLYLSGQNAIYYETELWGAALAAGALWAAAGVLERPTSSRIALAGVLTGCALTTRLSVGLGPVLALTVLWVASARRAPRGPLVGLGLAIVLPLGAAAAVNYAKFREPFGIPIERQVFSAIDPNRKRALAANHGTIFGPQFVPSTLLAAVRPDAVGSVRAFPWVGFPRRTPAALFDVRFDTRQRTLSALTSMPLLVALTIGGLVALARRRRWALLAVVLAAAGGYVGALTIGFITTRYLADLLPFLALGAAVGAQAAVQRRRRPRLVVGIGALLVAVGVATNGGAGLVEQRLGGGVGTESTRAAFVADQDRIDRFLGRRPRGVTRAPALPADTGGRRVGDLLVVGHCAGLFVADVNGHWQPVERTPGTGRFDVDLAVPPPGAERTVLTVGGLTVAVQGVEGGLRVSVHSQPPGAPVAASGRIGMRVTLDPGFTGTGTIVNVRVGGRTVGTAVLERVPTGTPAYGDGIVPVPARAPVCTRIARRAGLLA